MSAGQTGSKQLKIKSSKFFTFFNCIADVANKQWMIFLRKLCNFIFFFRLPDGMVHLRNLTVLGLNDMSLTELPDEFGR